VKGLGAGAGGPGGLSTFVTVGGDGGSCFAGASGLVGEVFAVSFSLDGLAFCRGGGELAFGKEGRDEVPEVVSSSSSLDKTIIS
jgi:hypothetical protein